MNPEDELDDDVDAGADDSPEMTEEEMDAYALARARQKFPEFFAGQAQQPESPQQAQPADVLGDLFKEMQQRQYQEHNQKMAMIPSMLADVQREIPTFSQASMAQLQGQLQATPLDVLNQAKAQGAHIQVAWGIHGRELQSGAVPQGKPGSAVTVKGVAGAPARPNMNAGNAPYSPPDPDDQRLADAFRTAFSDVWENKDDLERDIAKALGGAQ